MSIKVNCFDLFEVKYLNEKNEQKVAIESYLDLAKDFITNAERNRFSILSASYYIKVWINRSESHAIEPDKRFAEHVFSPEDFLTLSPNEIEKARNSANHETDSYMAEHYGATLPS